MKMILGLILSSFVAVSAFAQSPVAQGTEPSKTGAMSEHPPTPGANDADTAKDPHADKQSGGAIIRKNDMPASKQPAKAKKAKKMDQPKPDPKAGEKKAAPITPTPGESVD